jgi:hypothetical protein
MFEVYERERFRIAANVVEYATREGLDRWNLRGLWESEREKRFRKIKEVMKVAGIKAKRDTLRSARIFWLRYLEEQFNYYEEHRFHREEFNAHAIRGTYEGVADAINGQGVFEVNDLFSLPSRTLGERRNETTKQDICGIFATRQR